MGRRPFRRVLLNPANQYLGFLMSCGPAARLRYHIRRQRCQILKSTNIVMPMPKRWLIIEARLATTTKLYVNLQSTQSQCWKMLRYLLESENFESSTSKQAHIGDHPLSRPAPASIITSDLLTHLWLMIKNKSRGSPFSSPLLLLHHASIACLSYAHGHFVPRGSCFVTLVENPLAPPLDEFVQEEAQVGQHKTTDEEAKKLSRMSCAQLEANLCLVGMPKAWIFNLACDLVCIQY